MRMLEGFGRSHRWAVLLQSNSKLRESQRWYLIAPDLKVVGENKAGHNIQCRGATLAM